MKIACGGGSNLVGGNRLFNSKLQKRFRDPYLSFQPNIGDQFISYATERILDIEEQYEVSPRASQKSFDFINENCDIFIIRGGNYLSGDWISTTFPLEFLKKIRIPIVYFGAGIQRSIHGYVRPCSEETINCLKYIHDSCESCGVRGFDTANFLNSIGIKNVDVMGCPTVFIQCKNYLNIKPLNFDKVVWVFRRDLCTLNSDTERKLREAQFRMMADICSKFSKPSVVLHGEEKAFLDYYAARHWHSEIIDRSQVSGLDIFKISAKKRDYTQSSKQIFQWIKQQKINLSESQLKDILNNLFYSCDLDEFLSFLQDSDLVVGTRVHGVLPALAYETPALFYSYDYRGKELMEYFKVPIKSLAEASVEDINSSIDLSQFEKFYPIALKNLSEFFSKNGIKHKLPISCSENDPINGEQQSNSDVSLLSETKFSSSIKKITRLKQNGDFAEAVTEYRTAINLNPSFSWSYYGLGEVLRKQGSIENAVTQYKKAIELNPNHSCFYYSLGEALNQQGQVEEAIKYFQKAIEINPNVSMYYKNLGFVLESQGKLDEAINYYTKALELNASCEESLHRIKAIKSS